MRMSLYNPIYDEILSWAFSDFENDIPSLFKKEDEQEYDEPVDTEDMDGFFEIENVYPNKEKGAYCVLWKDGTKTVIHCQEGDAWDEEKALALCFMKKLFRNTGDFNDVIREWVDFDASV